MQTSLHHIALRGIANCVPKNTESNKDYTHINEAERRMFIKTTGIEERRVAEDGVCASDMCFKAAEKLLSSLNWKPESVDALIFVSQSPDYYLPATSIILQNKLGLSTKSIAFDVSLGCSGYVYGLHILGSLLNGSSIKRGILLCGDVSTNSVNYQDKSSYPIFGDSGSATALESDQNSNGMNFSLGSDGSGHKAIMIKGGGTKHKFNKDSLIEHLISPGITRHDLNIVLEGMDIFNFSVGTVPKEITALLESCNLTIDDIDFFGLHQANKIINETIRKKLKISKEKVPYSIEKFGNTSSGSIPLTLHTQLKKTLTSEPNKLLLSGFGVGLSWASVILETHKLVIPELIEI